MKTIFFVKNNSLKPNYQDVSVNNKKFVKHLRKIAEEHRFKAEIYPAILCDSLKTDECYGAMVELTYTCPEQIVEVAQVFKYAVNPGHVLLYVYVKDAVPPKEFELSKVASCTIADCGLQGVAFKLHNQMKAYLKRCGIPVSAVVFADGKMIHLQMICDPKVQPCYDYWQKVTGEFFRSIGLQPAFMHAAVLNY